MTGKIIDRRVVPDRYEIFENDNNVKSITFTVSKVNDGVDLTDLYAFVNLENENFITNKVLLSKSVQDDYIILTFNIDNAVSVDDGITKAQISFESSDLSIIYSTAVFCIDVKASVDSYSNTGISAQSLHELQSNLTKTIDGVNEKVNNAIQDAKSNLKFAELNIDGVIYDGSSSREIKHSVGRITELPKAIISEYEGETDDLVLYGTYNFKHNDVKYERPNGILGSVIHGLGILFLDEESPYYGKYRIRLQNCNGNYYEPLNGDEVRDGNSRVVPLVDQGSIYVNSVEHRSVILEVPLNQVFRKNTYYNLKLKYNSGVMDIFNDGIPLSISLYNKKTLEEKKIDIHQYLGTDIPLCNKQGERFYSGEDGEICLKVYINCGGGQTASITGMNISVVIEESDNPCDGFPLREVLYTDFYADEPLFCMKEYNENGELVDEIYDELDLKNLRIIRRVRKAIVSNDFVYQSEDLEKPFDLYIVSNELYSYDEIPYTNYDCAYRPTMKLKTPFISKPEEYFKFDISGNICYFNSEKFGNLEDVTPENCYFAFVYPLKYPKFESIEAVKIPYRKGLNCFDIESKYPVEHIVLKL